ncbi:MAG TPA: hypothetical protein DCQ90_06580 [Erysipelotrichaceae bacterium]|nr:hypothetical protein [Erysipelotrichaceae bacterium]
MTKSNLYAPVLLGKGMAIKFELISYSKNDDGNCAVIHILDISSPEPWVAVRNLATFESTIFSEWDHGFYFANRRHAEKKFYEMVGVLKEK